MELNRRELMAIAISRELRDGEVVLTGAASAIPLAACLLAQAQARAQPDDPRRGCVHQPAPPRPRVQRRVGLRAGCHR